MADSTDFYSLLGIEFEANEKEIRKAYRTKSLKCHPDKVGPNDSKAAEMFHLINVAVDTLTDPTKRKNYDDMHRAERLKRQRFNEMNKARQADRENLERKEAEAQKSKYSHLSKEAQQKLEIQRLKEEGIQKLLAKQEIKRQERAEAVSAIEKNARMNEAIQNASVSDCTIKVKWPKTETVDEIRIKNFFAIFGDIEKVIIKNKRSSIIVFKNVKGAVIFF
jgi:DnaJ family protein C protein 17